MAQKLGSLSKNELKKLVEVFERKIQREKLTRKTTEQLLKNKSFELYEANKRLKKHTLDLEKNTEKRSKIVSILINHLDSGVLLNDEKGLIIITNQEFRRIFKIESFATDILGMEQRKSAQMVKHLFKNPEEFIEIVDYCHEHNTEFVNKELILKDGSILECDFIPLASDEFFGYLWQVRDVTRARLAQKEIERSEEKYRGILENMELGLMEVDNDHIITKAYDRFCDMTGYTKEELIGKNAHELFLSGQYTQLIDAQDEQRKNSKQSIYEAEMKKKDGNLIWVLISGAPFYDEVGNMVGSIEIHYDITHKKQLEKALKDARNQAEKSRDAEKQFLANMSHEIRNPINAIIGITNLLHDTKPTKEQLDYLNNIKYSSSILLGLISGILDLSKIESGNMELAETEIYLKEMLNTLFDVIKSKAQEKELSFSINLNSSIDFYILADTSALNQIFLNLLGNAVKFTEKGGIMIEGYTIEEDAEWARLSFSIKDSGIGIPEDQLDNIFKEFKQADKETKLKYGGTGLGLAIAKKLINLYGGSISVQSTEGLGSTFTFDVKVKKTVRTILETEKEEFKTLDKQWILIVEDDKINQQYLSGILTKWNISYNIANDGLEAIKILEKDIYNMILMDIRMPSMDGYETTIRIRSSTNNANRVTPIVALTASALVDEKKRALSVGMNDHLSKPFTPEQLGGVLSKYGLVQKTDDSKFNHAFGSNLDIEHLKSLYENDYERAIIMCNIFLQTIDDEVEVLVDMFESKDWKGFASQSHKIKPNFALVGLTRLSDILKEFERTRDEEDARRMVQIKLDSVVKEIKLSKQLVEDEIKSMRNNMNIKNYA